MNEPRAEERNNGQEEQKEQMRQKMEEMQEKISESINKAMHTTADGLEKTANKMQQTAEFFRNKNADNLKDDLGSLAKKYPTQALAGAAIVGFFLGRILSR